MTVLSRIPDYSFLADLMRYSRLGRLEKACAEACMELLINDAAAFSRSNLKRHFTGSAVILDKSRQRILLTKHKKLGFWLQLGGHCDGDRNPRAVALKEGLEESGLTSITQITPTIFDVSIHDIPAHGGVPAHLHYDIRYLFEADIDEALTISDESDDLAWFKLDGLSNMETTAGFMTIVDKLKGLRS